MTINNKQILAFGFTLLLGLIQSNAWGLASDADQPIVIDSNTATYDDKTVPVSTQVMSYLYKVV